MKAARLAALRFFALLFLLPGLAGMIISAVVSTHYLDTLPQSPKPEERRVVPRGIHGATVYQTARENRELNWIEYSSAGAFLIGLTMGLIYFEKWGSTQVPSGEEESGLAENPR